MAIAKVVIGANYGDEGKGLTVDYFAREQAARGLQPLITRFNGGGQAGHTVVTPNGQRHVFSHVGAGTFVGGRTYLSSQFIVNPYTLQKELAKLSPLVPIIFAHPQCKVTTVYDMALNSLAELSRGSNRHGSCGMGVNETVTRDLASLSFKLFHVKMFSIETLIDMLANIANRWVPQRLEALGLTADDIAKHPIYRDALEATNYREQALYLKELVAPITLLDVPGLHEMQRSVVQGQAYILEGAQGLGLDEQLGAFPFVTRSICGLPSALGVAAFELEALEIEPIYVTRAYLTRHGAGPLALEGEPITATNLTDTTNVDNMWQGALRLAPLNLQQLKELIAADMARAAASPAVLNKRAIIKRPQLMVTCLDQLGDTVNVVSAAGTLLTVPSSELPQLISKELGREASVAYCSYGPTAAHVKSWI